MKYYYIAPYVHMPENVDVSPLTLIGLFFGLFAIFGIAYILKQL